MRRIVILVVLLLASVVSNQAWTQQIPTEEEARAELDKRGIDEAELIAALAAAGIEITSPNDLKNLTPEEQIKVTQIIEQLEEESKSKLPKDPKTSIEDRDNLPGPKVTEKDTIPGEEVLIPEEEVVDEEMLKDSIIVPELPIYGEELFLNSNQELYKQSVNAKAPDSYILGAGDEVAVSIFGRSQLDEKYEIATDGYVRINAQRVRTLLKGLTLGQAKEKLYKQYSEYFNFNRGQFEVTLNYARSVDISVYGQVLNPGPYTLDALNNVYNAMVFAKGPNETGSYRRIELRKEGQAMKKFDLYKFMSDPTVSSDYFLADNDVILVPVQGDVVLIYGEVKRPMRYELLDNEGLNELLEFAGGLTEKAYRKTLSVTRYEDDRQVVKDIPYSELKRSNRNFDLRDGDIIYIKKVEREAENIVSVIGEVENEGTFERVEGMRLSDLIDKAGLREEARTDIAMLVSTNSDASRSYRRVNIDAVLADRRGALDFALADKDELTIWSEARFRDIETIEVKGSVRFPEKYPYDEGQTIQVTDAITLAGGLKRDAGNTGIIHRGDPEKPYDLKYIRLDIDKIVENPSSDDNVVLMPFDRIEIFSDSTFHTLTYVTVSGAVNDGGQFAYGENMTVADALTLARGLRFGAALDNVEISRVIFKDNMSTKTLLAQLSIESDYAFDEDSEANYVLEPFDNVFVRYVPEFELQKIVNVEGEVKYPGPYAILNDNEKISSIIDRAGKLTEEAFPAGAKVWRSQDSIGYIPIRLDEVLKDKSSKYNFILKAGDRVEIPKQKDFVTIKGAIRADEVYQSDVIKSDNAVTVAFHKGKNAKWYIDNLGGGLADGAKKALIFVEHANGEISQTKWRFPFGHRYPDVRKGSTIVVNEEPEEVKLAKEDKEEVDWTKVLGDSVAQAMSILTLILLIQRLE